MCCRDGDQAGGGTAGNGGRGRGSGGSESAVAVAVDRSLLATASSRSLLFVLLAVVANVEAEERVDGLVEEADLANNDDDICEVRDEEVRRPAPPRSRQRPSDTDRRVLEYRLLLLGGGQAYQ